MNSMNTELMFSSKTNEWATPQQFFDELNKEFNFDLDPCSDGKNNKCKRFFTKEQDGLQQSWGGGLEYSAILHMVLKSKSGLRKHIEKVLKTIL